MRMFMWTIWLVSPAWISHTPKRALGHRLTSSSKDTKSSLKHYHSTTEMCMSFCLITAAWRQAANSRNSDTKGNKCREALLGTHIHFTLYKFHVSSKGSSVPFFVEGVRVKILRELGADQPAGGRTGEREAVLSEFRCCSTGSLLVTTDIES